MADRRLVAGVLCLLLQSGCGYRVAGRGEQIPDHVKVIAVPAFENKTTWRGAEHRLAEAVMREFLRRSRYKVVGRAEDADAVLKGSIETLRTLPVIFDPDTGRASAVQIELRLRVELVERETSRSLYRRDDYVFREEYEIATDLDSFFEERNPALSRLARDFAAALVSAVLENF